MLRVDGVLRGVVDEVAGAGYPGAAPGLAAVALLDTAHGRVGTTLREAVLGPIAEQQKRSP
eukprot:7135534-Alexandrium_andersonii.AAC.1